MMLKFQAPETEHYALTGTLTVKNGVVDDSSILLITQNELDRLKRENELSKKLLSEMKKLLGEINLLLEKPLS